jgi:hypothetical protein
MGSVTTAAYKKAWLPHELDLLQAAPGEGLTQPEIAKVLGRPYTSVFNKARALGLEFPQARRFRVDGWTASDLAALRVLIAAGESFGSCGAKLRRFRQD